MSDTENTDERTMSLEQLNGAVLVYETKHGEEVRVEFDE